MITTHFTLLIQQTDGENWQARGSMTPLFAAILNADGHSFAARNRMLAFLKQSAGEMARIPACIAPADEDAVGPPPQPDDTEAITAQIESQLRTMRFGDLVHEALQAIDGQHWQTCTAALADIETEYGLLPVAQLLREHQIRAQRLHAELKRMDTKVRKKRTTAPMPYALPADNTPVIHD